MRFTFLLALSGMAGGLAIGLLLSFLIISRSRCVRFPAIAYIEFFRAMPFIVVLIWIYYAMPILIKLSLSPFLSSVLALSLCQASYSAEIFRAGIESLEKGQMESARSLGMSYILAMRRIILPQAIRRMVPPIINSAIGMLKWSALASVIAVPELLYKSNMIVQTTFRPMEVYTTVAVFYFMLAYPIGAISRWLEGRYDIARK